MAKKKKKSTAIPRSAQREIDEELNSPQSRARQRASDRAGGKKKKKKS